jgi:purine-binding chemotaxis protein CheW
MATAHAHLLVSVATESYALDGRCVREVMRWRTLTPVPGAPPVLPGILSQRGVVVPVVDLRVLLGLPAQSPDRATRLVLAHHAHTDLALLVDAVIDLVELSDPFEPPPNAHTPTARLVGGVMRHGDRPLALLDLTALISAVQEGAA